MDNLPTKSSNSSVAKNYKNCPESQRKAQDFPSNNNNNNDLFHRRSKKPSDNENLSDLEFVKKLEEAIESSEIKSVEEESTEISKKQHNDKLFADKNDNIVKIEKENSKEISSIQNRTVDIIVIDSDDDLENELLIDKRNTEVENNKRVENEEKTTSRELSPEITSLPVRKLPPRENTPPRILSPDHLKEVIKEKQNESFQMKVQNENNIQYKNLKSKKETEISSTNNKIEKPKECVNNNNQNEVIEEHSMQQNDEILPSVSTEKINESFINFFDLTKDDYDAELAHKSLEELQNIRSKIENDIDFNLTSEQIQEILGYPIPDLDLKNKAIENEHEQAEKQINHNETRSETNVNRENNESSSKFWAALSEVVRKHFPSSAGPVTTTANSAITSASDISTCMPTSIPSDDYNNSPLTQQQSQTSYSKFQQQSAYHQHYHQHPIMNVPRYPMVNPNDPRFRSRVMYLYGKTERQQWQQQQQQQKQEQSCQMPLPPSGPPLMVEELPLSESLTSSTTKEIHSSVKVSSNSKTPSVFEQYKQKKAAIAKAAKEAEEQKKIHDSLNEVTKVRK